jgi:hypothetical protein
MTEQFEIIKRVFTNWKRLPLALRQRYWRETNYGELVPSFELLVEMDAALSKKDEGSS